MEGAQGWKDPEAAWKVGKSAQSEQAAVDPTREGAACQQGRAGIMQGSGSAHFSNKKCLGFMVESFGVWSLGFRVKTGFLQGSGSIHFSHPTTCAAAQFHRPVPPI